MHADTYALDVLAGLLNGRTGRLYKSMVLEAQGIAASSGVRRPGLAQVRRRLLLLAETKGDATPEQLEEAWYAELERLQTEPIPSRGAPEGEEPGIAADAFRRLQNNFFLMVQLLFYDGLGDWQYINTWSDKTLAVTADDVKRVAAKYFTEDNRAVAQYYRKAGSGGGDEFPGLSELDPQMQGPIRQQLKQIANVTDPAQLEGLLERIATGRSQAPPEMGKAFDVIENYIRQRIDELKSDNSDNGGEE